MTRIEGVMGNSNIEITVTYVHNTASHTIYHIYATGVSAAPTVTLTGPEGTTGTYTVPQINGYTSNYSGTISITYNNRSITIIYTAQNPDPFDDDTPV